MATVRQRKAMDKIIENGGIVSKAMLEVGYSPNSARTPQKLTESKGFRQLCEEAGLTDKFLTDALVEDIKLKPQNRKAELELGFKVKGLLREDADKGDRNLTINILNYTDGRDNDSAPIPATAIPATILEEPKEIQDSDSSQESWKIKDGFKLTDFKSTD